MFHFVNSILLLHLMYRNIHS